MLTNKIKKICIILLFSLLSSSLFAAAPDLGQRFLEKASEAFEDGDIETAYKNINNALKLSGEDGTVVYFAREIYKVKLDQLQKNFDPLELVDIQSNVEKYPSVASTTIQKIIKQIEVEQSELEKQKQQEQVDNQIKTQKEQFEKQHEQMQAQTNFMKEQADAIKEQANETKKSNKELIQRLEDGFNDLGNDFTESAKATEHNTKVIALSIIGIAILILLIVFCIIFIVRKGIKAQQVQQEQYIQAFKLLAANQSQTNRIMLGGVTDLYGSNPTLRLAGSSTWAPQAALPDVEFTEEDQEELKQLAVKCEEIGSKIDQITGRKNNSKNVSELVYKLSMGLGLSQGMAMLYFCASMVYDVGFLSIDPELLSAQSLTPEQKEILKNHVNLNENTLEFVQKKYWTIFEDAAKKHHENMDGSGYPQNLKGEEIPQIARLIRVAESYVSLSSKRNYRDTMDKETAVQTLMNQPQFYDIEVVKCLDQIV